MSKIQPRGQLLICEAYPGLREAVKLLLEARGGGYGLVFVEHPSEILPRLQRDAFRLLLWDLNAPTGSLETTLNAIRAGDNPETLRKTLSTDPSFVLGILKAVRHAAPALKTLLMAVQFDLDFQMAVVKQCGQVSFLPTPPGQSPMAIVEKIQIVLGDKKDSIWDRVVRVPLWKSRRG